jgi:hypothetical protein
MEMRYPSPEGDMVELRLIIRANNLGQVGNNMPASMWYTYIIWYNENATRIGVPLLDPNGDTVPELYVVTYEWNLWRLCKNQMLELRSRMDDLVHLYNSVSRLKRNSRTLALERVDEIQSLVHHLRNKRYEPIAMDGPDSTPDEISNDIALVDEQISILNQIVPLSMIRNY